MVVSGFGTRSWNRALGKPVVAWAEEFRGTLEWRSPNGYQRVSQMRLALWLCFSLELLKDTLNMHDRLRSMPVLIDRVARVIG